MRYHCREHRPLVYRGRYGEDLVFEVHGDDGRTYVVSLAVGDVAAVVQAVPARGVTRS